MVKTLLTRREHGDLLRYLRRCGPGHTVSEQRAISPDEDAKPQSAAKPDFSPLVE